MTTVYLYDAATGVYSGTYNAQESPLEPGTLIAPVNSTPIAPPTPGANQTVVYASGAWSQVADFIGLTYYVAGSDAPTTISALGVTPPAGYLTAAPITLAQAQAVQTILMQSSYQTAISLPVSYSSQGGVTETFQADSASVAVLQSTLQGMQRAGVAPTGFYWVAANNTQVPFTYADCQGLAAAMLAQGWPAFQHLQSRKAAISAATTVAEVQAVVW